MEKLNIKVGFVVLLFLFLFVVALCSDLLKVLQEAVSTLLKILQEFVKRDVVGIV
jgi:hypothetical protein